MHTWPRKPARRSRSPEDLEVVDNKVYFLDYAGRKHRVGVVYRRLSDEYLDPFAFNPDSVIGVPGILSAYRSGNVAIVNAPGNGAADDKAIYYFVPNMIRYYLGEEPILHNAPTYMPMFDKDRKEVLDRLGELVIKDVAEAGGYGVARPVAARGTGRTHQGRTAPVHRAGGHPIQGHRRGGPRNRTDEPT